MLRTGVRGVQSNFTLHFHGMYVYPQIRQRHGDIKPSNILTVPDQALVNAILEQRRPLLTVPIQRGLYKLADYGCACNLHQWPLCGGTPEYFAPEIADAIINDKELQPASLDGRVDIWALGMTVFECITGNRMFCFESGAEIHIARNMSTYKDNLREISTTVTNNLICQELKRHANINLHSSENLEKALDDMESIICQIATEVDHRPHADVLLRLIADFEAEEQRDEEQTGPTVEEDGMDGFIEADMRRRCTKAANYLSKGRGLLGGLSMIDDSEDAILKDFYSSCLTHSWWPDE